MREKIRLYKWQEEVLRHEGNITIRAGRQVGKSTIVSKKVANFARDKPGSNILVIAASQKQASWLFDKILGEIEDMEEKGMIGFRDKPTRTKILLDNGSQIHCLPAGRTGWYIRGLTLDLLVCDEAAFVNDQVFVSIIPMIAVSRKKRGLGWIILLSTPFGKGGYFHSTFTDPDFRQFHLSSEDCPHIPKDFLAKEKDRLTREEYAQEYIGEFIDDFRQFFPTQLVKKCATFLHWDTATEYDAKLRYYLGVDISRYGGDENAFVIAELDGAMIRIVKAMTTQRVSTMDTVGRIKFLDDEFGFRRIFIDDAGVGGGVYDALVEDRRYKRIVVGLNNAKRSVDADERKRGILKEDLYSNALVLMEGGKLEMIDDLRLKRSLTNIMFEYTAERRLKIFGKSDHLAEAFIRAAWCIKDKALNIFVS